MHNLIESLERRQLLSSSLVADAKGLYPTDAVTLNGMSYFTADDGVHGKELWRSDGTEEGTRMVLDLAAGRDSAQIQMLAAVADKLLFLRNLADGPSSLWVSDGTDAGTRELIPLRVGYTIASAEVVGGRLVLMVGDGNNNQRHDLYVSDGTLTGTKRISDAITEVDGWGNPTKNPLRVVGNNVVFKAADGDLWAIDGEDFHLRRLFRRINSLCPPNNGKMLVGVGKDLYITDGTASGTSFLAGLPGLPGSFASFGQGRWVFGFGVENHTQYWVSDGTTEGTRCIGSVDRSVQAFLDYGVPAGERFVFGVRIVTDEERLGHPMELWSTDGSGEGMQKVVTLSEGAGEWIGQGITVGRHAFFIVTECESGVPVDWRLTLWQSDGTAQGTKPVRDVSYGGYWPHEVKLSESGGKLVVQPPGKTIFLVDPNSGQVAEPTQAAAVLKDGTLRVYGTDKSDTIYVWRDWTDGNKLLVKVNGLTKQFSLAGFKRIAVYSYGGDDQIVLSEAARPLTAVSKIWSGDGNDTITSAGGSDTLYGGAGNDVITSGDGGDKVFAQWGKDAVTTGRGHDEVWGGDGNDWISTGKGDDFASGEGGADKLKGGDGTDLLGGGWGDDLDQIDGGFGADVLFGKSVYEIFFAGEQGEDPLDEVLLA